jgi:hypothetical protein
MASRCSFGAAIGVGGAGATSTSLFSPGSACAEYLGDLPAHRLPDEDVLRQPQRGDDRGDVVSLGVQTVVIRFLVRPAPAAKIGRNAAVAVRQFSDDEPPRPSGAAPVVQKDQRGLLVPGIADLEVQPLYTYYLCVV